MLDQYWLSMMWNFNVLQSIVLFIDRSACSWASVAAASGGVMLVSPWTLSKLCEHWTSPRVTLLTRHITQFKQNVSHQNVLCPSFINLVCSGWNKSSKKRLYLSVLLPDLCPVPACPPRSHTPCQGCCKSPTSFNHFTNRARAGHRCFILKLAASTTQKLATTFVVLCFLVKQMMIGVFTDSL